MADDDESYLNDLEREEARLFARQDEPVEIVRLLTDDQKSTSVWSRDAGRLNEEIENDKTLSRHCFYLISQQSTWGPFKISLDNFQRILKGHGFPPYIASICQAFGRKVSDNQQLRSNSYHFRTTGSLSSVRDEVHHELSYRLQYIIPNRCRNDNPYSSRQLGVCHNFCISTGRSRWIVLSSFKEIRERLEQLLNNVKCQEHLVQNPVHVHRVFLAVTNWTWEEYIEHLRLKLEQYEAKACFSRVGRKFTFEAYDYSVAFADCQKLELFQRKLMYQSSALKANLGVLRNFGDLQNTFETSSSLDKMLAEIRVQARQLEFYIGAMNGLIERCRDAVNLLLKIVEFRNGETLRLTNAAMHQSLALLTQQSETLAEVSKHGQKDSKALRALSVIATLYLPASLVATVFSSSLVERQPMSSSPQPLTHLNVASQFWIFVVTTMALMVVTVGGTRWLENVLTRGRS